MIREFEPYLDRNWMEEHIRNLYRLERKQTSAAWQQAAEYVYALLKKEGFDAELLPFPSDGVASFQDKRTPIGWDVSHFTFTLRTPAEEITDPVIADYEREPLHAVKHSVSTPEGGIDARIVTEEEMREGIDVRDAFVLLDASTRPQGEAMRMLLDGGAYGWISDYVENPGMSEDGIAWINAGTEYNAWHVQADDREFISCQISPKNGKCLRSACKKGPVTVHAESDGHRYETVLPVVTAVLPGESPRELWLNAHLYEPLIDDNSSGVIASVAILRALRRMAEEGKIRQKYTVRVVFGSEMYGFAAFAEHFGDTRSMLGGIVMDGLNFSREKDKLVRAFESIDYHGESRTGGFGGNILLEEVCGSIEQELPDYTVLRCGHQMGDDMFLSDPTNGLRTVWFVHGKNGFHHNSEQNEALLDMESGITHTAICGEWVRRMTAPDEKEIIQMLPKAAERAQRLLEDAVLTPVRPGTDQESRMRFLYERECGRLRDLAACAGPKAEEAAGAAIRTLRIPETPAAPEGPETEGSFEKAGTLFFTRLVRGFPHDLVKLPRAERFKMPGTILYDTLSEVVSRMTPGLSLKDLLREVEWDKGIIFPDETIAGYIDVCEKLAKAGYFAEEIRR